MRHSSERDSGASRFDLGDLGKAEEDVVVWLGYRQPVHNGIEIQGRGYPRGTRNLNLRRESPTGAKV